MADEPAPRVARIHPGFTHSEAVLVRRALSERHDRLERDRKAQGNKGSLEAAAALAVEVAGTNAAISAVTQQMVWLGWIPMPPMPKGEPGDDDQMDIESTIRDQQATIRARQVREQSVVLGILLAFLAEEITVPVEIIQAWTEVDRDAVAAYAALRYRAARGEEVEVPPMPAVLAGWRDRMASETAPEDPREIVRQLFNREPEPLPDPAAPAAVVALLAGLNRELPLEVAEGWTPEERLAVAMWATAEQLRRNGTDLEVPPMPDVAAEYFAPGAVNLGDTPSADSEPGAAPAEDADGVDVHPRDPAQDGGEAPSDAPPAGDEGEGETTSGGGGDTDASPASEAAFHAVGSGSGRGRKYSIWCITGPLAGTCVLPDLAGTGVAAEAKRITDALNAEYHASDYAAGVDWRTRAAELAGRAGAPESDAAGPAEPGPAAEQAETEAESTSTAVATAEQGEPAPGAAEVDLTHAGGLPFYMIPADGRPGYFAVVDRSSQSWVDGYDEVPEAEAAATVRRLSGLDASAGDVAPETPQAATPAMDPLDLEAPGFAVVSKELALLPATSPRESAGVAQLLHSFARRAPEAWAPLVRGVYPDRSVWDAVEFTARALGGGLVHISGVGQLWVSLADAETMPVLHASLTGMQLGITFQSGHLLRWLRELFKIREPAPAGEVATADADDLGDAGDDDGDA
ncbi:MAG: hypothetical protein AB1941_10100 [Gemmatimonadota bacterium]